LTWHDAGFVSPLVDWIAESADLNGPMENEYVGRRLDARGGTRGRE
jgi:hypothetical protein